LKTLSGVLPDHAKAEMKTTLIFCLLFGLAGCGASTTESAGETPYRVGDATLLGEEKGGEEVRVTECDSLSCEAVGEQCGDEAAADVILNENGEVIEVLCYKQDVSVSTVDVSATGSATAGNNTVLVVDGVDDGLDVEGDVTISGNNAIIYGEGPDVSVIGGTLDIEKNNAIVRGVRIKEDVTIEKNNTKLVFCVIEGDLTITGNNTTLAECTVFGRVTIRGLNTVLVQNQFAGTDTVAGSNLTCNQNVRVDDANTDFAVSEDEVAGAVECVPAEGPPAPQTDAGAG
jgi:hypothetical protein